MKVVAIGGCGGMGRFAVQTLLTYDFVDEIVIADLDGERAASLAAESGPKATSARLDVSDEAAVAAALSDADAVLNTVGPFFRFGVPVLRAAIGAGCQYFDINDDWEPTLDMLELDQEAREAGVTAIVGIGASPGVSNLLAATAASRLEGVEEVITGWGFGGAGGGGGSEQGGEPPTPSAALVHWMHQCSGTIRVLRDGEFADVPPIEEVSVQYPGLGKGTAWTVGHPEAVTLPRWRPEIRRCQNVMAGSPRVIEALRAIAAEIDAGRLTAEQGAQLLMSPQPADAQPSAERPASADAPRLPPLFATAKGTRAGKATTVAVTIRGMPAGGMGGSTGVPLAVALRLFAEGEISKRGVFAPEQAIDPDAFFDALAPLCTPPRVDAGDMLMVSTSG